MMDAGKSDRMECKMKMWKMRKEMLDSLGEKELRAFITGYMMAESRMKRHHSCGCNGGCSCGCNRGCSCGCGGGGECSCKECSTK